jgi:cytoskeletal protein RodZ
VAFSNSSELPDSQIEYRDTGGARRWVALLIYLVLALVVATLVVFAGRWVYHRVSNNSSPAPTTLTPKSSNSSTKTSPSPAPPSSSSQNKAGSASPNSSSGSSSSATSGNKSTSNGAAKPAPQPSTLPNNGPGEDIALFVGTTFIAATLHFMFTLRRAAKST